MEGKRLKKSKIDLLENKGGKVILDFLGFAWIQFLIRGGVVLQQKALRSIVVLFPEGPIEGIDEFRKKHIHDAGGEIPFHITLLYDFLLPDNIDEKAKGELKEIAGATPKFPFFARPISSFPTTRVLYLSPTPLTPIEKLREELVTNFPIKFWAEEIPPVFHMTLALKYPQQEEGSIIKEYFAEFGREPLRLWAGSLGIYALTRGRWEKFLKVEIG